MKHVDMSILAEKRKLTKEESMDLVDQLTSGYVVSREVALYLVGLKEEKEFLSESEIKKEQEQILSKHKKAVKYAKKQKLPLPEMPSLDVSPVKNVIVAHPYARNHKEDFYPQLKLIPVFNALVADLSNFPVNMIELRKKDNEFALGQSCNHLYTNQSLVGKAWRDVQIDYLCAFNDVIHKEFLRDFATLLATVTEYRKFVNNKGKQCDQRIRKWYDDVLSQFDHKRSKDEWFKLVLEDLLTLAAGCTTKGSPIPCDLTEYRIFFSKSFDQASKSVKQMLK